MKIKDALLALDEAQELGTLWATISRSDQTVHIHYTIPDTDHVFTGTVSMYNSDPDDYARRILAAGSSVASHFECNAAVAEASIKREIRPHSLKILTSSAAWTICGHTKNRVIK